MLISCEKSYFLWFFDLVCQNALHIVLNFSLRQCVLNIIKFRPYRFFLNFYLCDQTQDILLTNSMKMFDGTKYMGT